WRRQRLTVVAVCPEGSSGTTRAARPKIFVPITMRGLMEPPFAGFDDRTYYWAYLFARLKPGVSIQQATADIKGPYQTIIATVDLPLQHGLSDAKTAEFKAKRITV